jgi:hypothetical protein
VDVVADFPEDDIVAFKKRIEGNVDGALTGSKFDSVEHAVNLIKSLHDQKT